MVPKSIFVAQPAVAFQVLLQACAEALGHSVTDAVDSTPKILSDSERFLSILAAMKDEQAQTGFPPNLLTHVSFSVLTIAPDVDMIDILECCSGMSFMTAETTARGVMISVTTGTVQQWRDAIVAGTNHQQPIIRKCFNDIHNLFVEVGLAAVWNKYEQKPRDDGSYKLIEYRK